MIQQSKQQSSNNSKPAEDRRVDGKGAAQDKESVTECIRLFESIVNLDATNQNTHSLDEKAIRWK